ARRSRRSSSASTCSPSGSGSSGSVTDGPLLEFRDVGIAYATRAGEVPVIPALSFRMDAGEAMGLVGESGCGKSTVALSIVRYLGRAGRLVRGRILFEGRDLATLDAGALRAVRGRRIAMVYQDPMASLNPVMTVGRQLMEVPMIHEGVGAAAAHDHPLHQPQPRDGRPRLRPDRGDVPRRARRGGFGPPDLHRPTPSLYPRPSRLPAGAGARQASRPPCAHSRPARARARAAAR